MANDVALLRIETQHLSVELHGPYTEPGNEPQSMTIRTNSSHEVSAVSVATSSGPKAWRHGDPGPYLREDTRYRLTVETIDPARAVDLEHRDPFLLQHLLPIGNRPGLRSGVINFGRQVGTSDIRVRVGADWLIFSVEVRPTKIDYRADFRALVGDLHAVARGLALDYLRATTTSLTFSSEVRSPTTIEWLSTTSELIDTIESALQYVAAHPHRTLVREVSQQRVERVRGGHSSVRRAVTTGAGSGDWIGHQTLGPIRSRVPDGRPTETVDNAENRWLRLQLGRLRDQLSDVIAELRTVVGTLKRAQRSSVRVEAELQSVIGLRQRVERMTTLAPLASAVGPVSPDFVSLTLGAAPGYREAHRSLNLLRRGLDVSDGDLPASIKDLDVLYETWCFIKVVQSVCNLVGGSVQPTSVIQVDDSGVRVRLRRGVVASISVAAPGRIIRIQYNRSFDSLTGEQRPDIILELLHDGWPEIVLILDAKYRIDLSPTYLRTFDSPGPPIDAVNALHRYRDAITQPWQGRLGRPVVKGAALFPLNEADTFRTHRLWRALDELGIGAIPLLPDNSALLSEWLGRVLALSPAELSHPGPPFMALEHARDANASDDNES